MHGVGKTTLVNSININRPILKFIDSDLIPIDGRGYRQQIFRLDSYEDFSISLYPIIDTIADRSPLDFKVYNDLVMPIGSAEWKDCDERTNDLIQSMKDKEYFFEWKNILVYDDYNAVMKRVRSRDRRIWGEDDEEYNRAAYRMFYSAGGDYFTAITGEPSILVHIDDAKDYIESLFLSM